MKTAQFTSGPWVMRPDSTIESKDGVTVASFIDNKPDMPLIAAAPAMYAELVAGLVLLEASYQDMCGKYGTDSLHAQTVWERVERTRQVIAQAEGRQ